MPELTARRVTECINEKYCRTVTLCASSGTADRIDKAVTGDDDQVVFGADLDDPVELGQGVVEI